MQIAGSFGLESELNMVTLVICGYNELTPNSKNRIITNNFIACLIVKTGKLINLDEV
jgi:hypothetical protein